MPGAPDTGCSPSVLGCLLGAVFLVSALATPCAAESGFSAYGLGTSAFEGGVTPPPGTYVSAGVAAIRGDINGALTFGGVEIDVAMQIKEFISPSANLLYVPKQTFLGGRAGFSMTVPFGFVDIAAQATGPLGNTVELVLVTYKVRWLNGTPGNKATILSYACFIYGLQL